MTCWLASGGAKRRAPQHRVLRGHGHKYQTSVPQWERQFRLVRVHDEHREELGRLRLAGIGADAVAVGSSIPQRRTGRNPKRSSSHRGMRDPYRGRSEDLRDRQNLG